MEADIKIPRNIEDTLQKGHLLAQTMENIRKVCLYVVHKNTLKQESYSNFRVRLLKQQLLKSTRIPFSGVRI